MAGALYPQDVRCVGADPMFRAQASASRWEMGSAWPERFLKKPVDWRLIAFIMGTAAHVL
jgi:hypothetical protein